MRIQIKKTSTVYRKTNGQTFSFCREGWNYIIWCCPGQSAINFWRPFRILCRENNMRKSSTVFPNIQQIQRSSSGQIPRSITEGFLFPRLWHYTVENNVVSKQRTLHHSYWWKYCFKYRIFSIKRRASNKRHIQINTRSTWSNLK